ncbi:N-acetylhexosamine 1-kinase [Lachnospiraceae bacterium TWA4]|nr:N-acetylhexosamine 1-kinase [Lachnospiraceae bacterium TWA4]
MAADMLAAYYDNAENTKELFDQLKISKKPSYEVHINRYNVLKIDMQSFLNKGKTVEGLIQRLNQCLIKELKKAYPDMDVIDEDDLSEICNSVLAKTGIQFVIIIDEWDCVMRRIHEWKEQKLYLDYLRDWLKDQPYIALAYMTGILPIKNMENIRH